MSTVVDVSTLKSPTAKALTQALRKYREALARPLPDTIPIFKKDLLALRNAAAKKLKKTAGPVDLVFDGIRLVEYADLD